MASNRDLMVATSDYLKQTVAKQAGALRARKINPEFFEQVLLNALVSTPDLAKCEKLSLYKACADAVDFGCLPDGKHGAIVPLGGKAEFWPMLAGLLSKVRKELPNISINAWPVFMDVNDDSSGDEFEDHRGTSPRILHRPDPHVVKSDDNLFAVYAVVFHPGNAVPEFEVLYRDEIDKFRKTNKGPWTTYFVRMAVARPLKRMLNRLPLTGTTLQMINQDPDRDTEDGQIVDGHAVEVLDPPPADREPDPDPDPPAAAARTGRRGPARRRTQQPAQEARPAVEREPERAPPVQQEMDTGGQPDDDGGADDYDPTQDLG